MVSVTGDWPSGPVQSPTRNWVQSTPSTGLGSVCQPIAPASSLVTVTRSDSVGKAKPQKQRRGRWRVSSAVTVELVQADAGTPDPHCRAVLVGAVRKPSEQVQPGGGAAGAYLRQVLAQRIDQDLPPRQVASRMARRWRSSAALSMNVAAVFLVFGHVRNTQTTATAGTQPCRAAASWPGKRTRSISGSGSTGPCLPAP
jgi:hypothetical protein